MNSAKKFGPPCILFLLFIKFQKGSVTNDCEPFEKRIAHQRENPNAGSGHIRGRLLHDATATENEYIVWLDTSQPTDPDSFTDANLPDSALNKNSKNQHYVCTTIESSNDKFDPLSNF